jgi:ABC-type glycerol-3-phosphate transport system substrate-binding protein
MFYWRKKEAEEAGWTEEDIAAKATRFGFDSPLDEFFESINDPANDRYATVVRGKRGHHIMSDFYHFAYPMGSSWFDGSYVGTYNWVPTYNDAPNVEAADYYGHMIRDYCPPGTENYEHHHREEAFSTGRAVNSVGENCFMLPLAWRGGGENRDTLTPGADKDAWYECGYIPTPTAKRKTRWWPGEFPQLMNGKSSAKELSWEWIKYCCLPENEDIMLSYGNSICRYSTANDATIVKKWSEDKPEEGARARPWLATWPTTFSDGTKPRPVELPEYPEHDDIAGTALNLCVIQEMTPQEAMDEAQSKIEKVMRDAGYAEKFWSKAPADLKAFVNM